MDMIKETIARQARRIRNDRRLSLDEASHCTEISKAMISQIERGQSTPTVTTLWKMAAGYKVPLTWFLNAESAGSSLIDTWNTPAVLGEDGKMKTRTIFPYDPSRSLEMLYIEWDPGCIHPSDGHMTGVEEYIFVKEGRMKIKTGHETVLLTEAQCFRFKADIPHIYSNPFPERCSVLNMIFYPHLSVQDRKGDR
jgi:transcriptional regulator with XRE-family HTH domain